MTRLIVALALLVTSALATAEVYSYVDKEGNRVFTDRPTAGNAKAVDIKPGNVLPTPTVPQTAPPSPPAQVRRVFYTSLNIDSPAPEATVRGGGDVTVTVSSEPAILPGHAYRVLLDGSPAGQPNAVASIALTNIDRGTHQLAVEIINQAGEVMLQSKAQPLFVHRTSLSQKRRIHPCQKDDYGVRPECPLADKPPEPRKRILGVF
ncbi:DUF4124 domain-containing protein [Pseudomonas matsuisoli]|uniref:Penicillin-binding protein n=1 Tax=Pseudomonas matsuisoli TaxID=1515666 RepID=A0A917V089_9PSED|nr:DUF4124 domain-containing protein [Pseudomonas matsuisoli]GGK04212.1 penicillin-binding protein [Pseudomonas matsuisoli]